MNIGTGLPSCHPECGGRKLSLLIAAPTKVEALNTAKAWGFPWGS